MSAFKPANNDCISIEDKELDALFPKAKTDVAPPSFKGCQYLVNGEIKTFTKATEPIATAIYAGDERIVVSEFAMCDKGVALEALAAAQAAWDKGRGEWPNSAIQERVRVMCGFLQDYKTAREEMAEFMMWDICKSKKDATDEIDRTIGECRFVPTCRHELTKVLKTSSRTPSTRQSSSTTTRQVSRSAPASPRRSDTCPSASCSPRGRTTTR